MSMPLEFALHDPELTVRKAVRAKQLDDERKLNLFDCKKRLIGVDVNGLNAQVEENKLKKRVEAELDRKYNLYYLNVYKEEKEIELTEKLKRKEAILQLQNYWKTQQRKELSREFDLNDPDYLKKSLPMCINDNDPRIKSKGSLLRFEGEDYDGVGQKKKSKNFRQTLDEQVREKNEWKTCIKLCDDQLMKEAAMNDEICKKCDDLEDKIRKEETRHVMMYNLALAHKQKAERQMEIARSNSDDLAHVYNCLTSSLFAESGKEGQVPLSDVIECRKQQLLELEDIRNNERTREEYYKRSDATRCFEEQQIEDYNKLRVKDELLKIRNENKLLAIEQRQRRKAAELEARNCNPTDEFYAQFNKTAK